LSYGPNAVFSYTYITDGSVPLTIESDKSFSSHSESRTNKKILKFMRLTTPQYLGCYTLLNHVRQ